MHNHSSMYVIHGLVQFYQQFDRARSRSATAATAKVWGHNEHENDQVHLVWQDR